LFDISLFWFYHESEFKYDVLENEVLKLYINKLRYKLNRKAHG